MSKIELSADEIKVIHQQLNGEIEIYNATDEQQRLLSSVIDKADALLDETDAYDELEEQGNDLVQWFWNKYQEQQKQA
jgi:hypothetical protein